MTPVQILIAACAALVLLTFIVAGRMLAVRIGEMRKNKIEPQTVSLSAKRASTYQDSRASDNYNHLFEVPVLFYALCATAIASGHVPGWLSVLACVFVASRYVHSFIQCTYNKVMHRFAVFLIGLFMVVSMWLAFAVSYLTL